jgi:hypothetical protein
MAESSKSCEVGEPNKLAGIQNYNVWMLLLTNKLHNMILKEGGDVTTYLMEGSNLRNHLMTLGETISDKQLINIVLNGLPRSYDMVVQGISYFQNPTYEDVMGKILTKAQRLSAREQKLGQDEALTVQGSYHFGQTRGSKRGRGFVRPNFNLSHYPRPYGYPQFQVRPPIPGQFRSPKPHTHTTIFSTSYSISWSQASFHLLQMSYYPDPSQFNVDVVFSNYYDQNWYVDSGTSSHLTGDSSNLDLDMYSSSGQIVSTAYGVSHPMQGSGSANVSFGSGSIKLQHILYVPALKRNLVFVGCLTDQKHVLVFQDNCFLVLDNKYNRKIVAIGDRDCSNGLYKFRTANFMANLVNKSTSQQLEVPNSLASSIANPAPINHADSTSNSTSQTLSLWHNRYSHLHQVGLNHLAKNRRARGLPMLSGNNNICEACMAGRQHKERFPKASSNRTL